MPLTKYLVENYALNMEHVASNQQQQKKKTETETETLTVVETSFKMSILLFWGWIDAM